MSSEELSEDSFDSENCFDILQPGFDNPECDPYRLDLTLVATACTEQIILVLSQSDLEIILSLLGI